MVSQPRLLLADEPTGALDTRSGEQVMELFAQLHSEGVTIVMITHEPEIARHAQRIVTIRDGMRGAGRLRRTPDRTGGRCFMTKGKKIVAVAVFLAVVAGGTVGGTVIYRTQQTKKNRVDVMPVANLTQYWWGDDLSMDGQVVSGDVQNVTPPTTR